MQELESIEESYPALYKCLILLLHENPATREQISDEVKQISFNPTEVENFREIIIDIMTKEKSLSDNQSETIPQDDMMCISLLQHKESKGVSIYQSGSFKSCMMNEKDKEGKEESKKNPPNIPSKGNEEDKNQSSEDSSKTEEKISGNSSQKAEEEKFKILEDEVLSKEINSLFFFADKYYRYLSQARYDELFIEENHLISCLLIRI